MITINNLSFSYGKHTVLSNLSMTLEPGHIYGLLGENGVGKTTFLSLLCGLKKPAEGQILLSSGETPWDRRPSFLQEVFFLPDELPTYAGTPTEYESDYAPFWKDFDIQGYYQLLQRFDINLTQRMDQMSYGQLKKVHIAFALRSGAHLILMDEPTNGLDIPSKMQFREVVKEGNDSQGTIIISTHQVRDVAELIDHIVILDIGKVLLNDSISNIKEKMYQDGNPFGLSGDFDIEQLFYSVHRHADLL